MSRAAHRTRCFHSGDGRRKRLTARGLFVLPPRSSLDATTLLAGEANTDAARAALPWATAWCPVVVGTVIAFASSGLAAWVAQRIALDRRAAERDAPWPERARAAWPARLTGLMMFMAAPAVCAAALPLFAGALTRPPRALLVALFLVTSAAGVHAAQRGPLRRIEPRHGLSRSLQSAIAAALIFLPHVVVAAVVVSIALNLSPPPSWWAGLAGSVVTLIGAVAAGRANLAFARALKVVRPAPEHLREAVVRMSEAMQIPVRSVEALRMPMANAMVFPGRRAVLFTESALEVLDAQDVGGICAHELAHLSEPRAVLAGRVATSLAPAVGIAAVPLATASLDQGAWVFPLAGILAAALGQRLLQPMETRADATARAHEPSPGAYARALTRLHEANLTPVVMAGSTSHPSLFDRLTSLGAPPAFPRPPPPSTSRAVLAATAGVAAVVLVSLVPPLWLVAQDDGTSTLPIVLTGGARTHLIQRGFADLDAHHLEAEALFRACLAEREDDGTCATGLMVSLSRQPGRCAEALRIGRLAAEAAAAGAGDATAADVAFVEAWTGDVRSRCGE